jgi:acetyltransferase
VFILESAISKGLRFNSVWSIGNGKQIGVEDVLQYMDEHFEESQGQQQSADSEHQNFGGGSRIKLLYIESIRDPDRLLFHAASLIRKGCHIAAIKSGTSESGSRAASSHTGALASSDAAVEALFRKAGIIRVFSREELTTVGCILTLPPLRGLNIGIITHAGGPAVMLTDALSKGGLNVPKFEGPEADSLKSRLFPGASVGNPIDILATGTPEQLGSEHRLLRKGFSRGCHHRHLRYAGTRDGVRCLRGAPSEDAHQHQTHHSHPAIASHRSRRGGRIPFQRPRQFQ